MPIRQNIMNDIEIIVGGYYYFGKCIKRFKCVDIGTDVSKEQSDFIDYKKGLHQFYNHEMYRTKWVAKKL